MPSEGKRLADSSDEEDAYANRRRSGDQDPELNDVDGTDGDFAYALAVSGGDPFAQPGVVVGLATSEGVVMYNEEEQQASDSASAAATTRYDGDDNGKAEDRSLGDFDDAFLLAEIAELEAPGVPSHVVLPEELELEGELALALADLEESAQLRVEEAKAEEESAADRAIGALADSLTDLSRIVENATLTIQQKADERRALRQKRLEEEHEFDIEGFRRITQLAVCAGDLEALRALNAADPEHPLADLWLLPDNHSPEPTSTNSDTMGDGEDGEATHPTLLHVAAIHGQDEIAKFLLGLGMDATYPIKQVSSKTPLHLAAASGSASVVSVLLEGGADADGHTILKDGHEQRFHSTPLHLGAASGMSDAVHRLLEKGANAAALDENGLFPWMCATSEDIFEELSSALCPETTEQALMKFFWCARALWDPLRSFGDVDEQNDDIRLSIANEFAETLKNPAAVLASSIPSDWLDQMYGDSEDGVRASTLFEMAVNSLDSDWVALLMFHGVTVSRDRLEDGRLAFEAVRPGLEGPVVDLLMKNWRAISIMLTSNGR